MSKIMRPLSRGLGILAVAGLAGCGLGGRAHGPPSPNASAVVDMGFSSFQPETVHIRAGQTVEWRNTSIVTHSVSDDSRVASKPQDASIPAAATPFSSGDIPAGEVFAASFPVPGTYKYFCTHHEGEGMLGTVVVEPAS
jgi:plastocyanin